MPRIARYELLNAATLLAAALAAAGCASDADGPTKLPEEGHAFLTIVGDRNVFLASGDLRMLQVKYHDEAGTPLAGEIRFRIEGEPEGARLTDDAEPTRSSGEVEVELQAGTGADAAFRVIAEAQYATSVDWRVAISAGDEPPKPVKIEGTYRMESTFDLVSGIPGTAGKVVNAFVDLTDETNDPASWLIDLAVEELDSESVKRGVDKVRPALDVFLNGFLKRLFPDIVERFKALGNSFGDVAKEFGLKSEVVIRAAGEGIDRTYTATHTITGIFWTVDRRREDFELEQLEMRPIVIENVPVTLPYPNRVELGAHELTISYGQLLVFALNHLVIPAVDPAASNMEELLIDFIYCDEVGREMYEYVDEGWEELYVSACETAISFIVGWIEDKFAEIGQGGTKLVLQGKARPVDETGDDLADRLLSGRWWGTFAVGPASTTLSDEANRFTGTRVESTGSPSGATTAAR